MLNIIYRLSLLVLLKLKHLVCQKDTTSDHVLYGTMIKMADMNGILIICIPAINIKRSVRER